MIGWIAIYVIAGVTALLFEFGPLKGFAVSEAKVIYILEVVGVLASLALIPLALRDSRKWLTGWMKRIIPRKKKSEYT